MKKLLFPLLLALITSTQAQITKPKFGKVTMEEMTMTKYEGDTVAAALILFDDAFCDFKLDSDNEFKFNFTRHFRAKIFKKSAYNLAEISIRIFGQNADKEKIYGLEANTYNLVDGKIVKTKLNSNQIFLDETKYSTNKKFAFPEIREGSVIEYTYTLSSHFFYNLRGWDFQYKYPALWSQCTYETPEYFEYHKTSRGYLPFDISTTTESHTKYTVRYKQEQAQSLSASGRPTNESYDIDAALTKSIFTVNNVPAFIEEPNTDCDENYIQSVQYELKSIQFPHSTRKDYTRTWESVVKDLNSDEDFGKLITNWNSNFIEDLTMSVTANLSTDLEKANAIYTFVQNEMSWDGENRLYASDGLKKPFEQKSGNSSEINLLLIKMLRTAKISANPVIISTRSNGMPLSYYPSMSNYNSVIAKVEIGEKSYLLDAINDFCPFGVLPAQDLNGKGRFIGEETSYDVELSPIEKYRNASSYNLSITEDGVIKGIAIDSYSGYAAISIRNAVSKEKTTDDFIRKIQENNSGLTINKYGFANKLSLDKPFIDTLEVEITEQAEVIGDKIILSPLLYDAMQKNIYTLENRQYPVIYNYPESEILIYNYTIPEGYIVESMPKSTAMKLEDGSASVAYSLQQVDNNIKISYKRTITKSLFLPEEYSNLKEFYDQIVRINSEKIILKKAI